jgi:hypothetical protein
MRRAFLGRLGAVLITGAAGVVLLSSCGAQVVPPGYPPSVGPGQGMALINLWDQSCQPGTGKRTEDGFVPSCDFSESVLVIGRVGNPQGDKQVVTERIQFEPGYQLMVLPIGTWKVLRVEWNFRNEFTEFKRDYRQFIVRSDVVSDWGVIGLQRMNVKAFRFVREESKPGEAQKFLDKNWPTLKKKVVSGLAGPADRVDAPSTEPP